MKKRMALDQRRGVARNEDLGGARDRECSERSPEPVSISLDPRWRGRLSPIQGPPAEALGLIPRAMTVGEVLAERCFPEQAGIPGWASRCYFGQIATRAMARCQIGRAHV